MSPEALELLERRLSRLCEQHGSQLPFEDNEALKAIDLHRKATITEAYERLLSSTASALAHYLDQVRSNVLLVAEETAVELSSTDRDTVLRVASSKLDPSLYIRRFDLFGEAVGRYFGRAGMSIELEKYRTDLYRTRQQAGTGTTISRFLASLGDDLDLLVQRKQRIAAERPKPAPDARPHWTSHWGFWLTTFATAAGIAGTYRAFVPPASSSSAATLEQRQSPIASKPVSSAPTASPAQGPASQASRAQK